MFCVVTTLQAEMGKVQRLEGEVVSLKASLQQKVDSSMHKYTCIEARVNLAD